MQIMVDGRVPTGSGLSSSSALTCATAVAVMAAHNLSFTKAEVADFACKCERHCGTQSGGMDQVCKKLSGAKHSSLPPCELERIPSALFPFLTVILIVYIPPSFLVGH
jgi:N-acetylgalactosamine kinase